jgi:tRNA/tmRNA/rRNA uracil-C5-methylase (TrmA/RlmC/RlmD family)
MSNLKIQPILDCLVTKEDADKLFDQVDHCVSKIYINSINIQKQLSESFPRDIYQQILRICEEQKVDFEDPQTVEKVLNDIKDQVSKVEKIHVVLADKFTDDFIIRLSSWVDTNLPEKYLLDIKVDEGIIGGAQISINDKYYDYSLKKIVERYHDESLNMKQESFKESTVQE